MAYFQARHVGMVELTDERRRHIIGRHPEVKPYLHRLSDVLADPTTVRRSRHDPNVLIFYRRVTKARYLAAVVKTNARTFVLTAYITDRIAHPTAIL